MAGKCRGWIYEMIAVFFLFSFLGWGMETVLCAWADGVLVDRGFLRLPFCTIYGFTILAIYWLIGTPRSGGILLRRVKSVRGRYFLYYLLAVLIPTGAELVTGLIFEHAFGLKLWDYSWHRFHFMGYISLGISLSWGVLIMAVMGCFPWLLRKIRMVPGPVLKGTGICLCVVTAADYISCLAAVMK